MGKAGGKVARKSNLTRIIRPEPKYDVAVRLDHKSIPPHRKLWKCLVVHIHPGFLLAPHDGLEPMPVQMERMLARIQTVKHNLHHLTLPQHERIRVAPVHTHIRRHFAGREGRVQSGHFRAGVGAIVEEGVVGAVAQVVHFHVESDGAGDVLKKGKAVVGDEGEVVKGIECVDEGRGRERGCFVVDEPARDVGVEGLWDGVEEILQASRSADALPGRELSQHT